MFVQTWNESAPRERAVCFEFWVKAGKGVPDDADDDGGIVEDVGEEDEDERGWLKGERMKSGK